MLNCLDILVYQKNVLNDLIFYLFIYAVLTLCKLKRPSHLNHIVAFLFLFLIMSNDKFYGLQAQKGNGEIFKFEQLRGKVVLIVNVASRCGFTPQYKDLE